MKKNSKKILSGCLLLLVPLCPATYSEYLIYGPKEVPHERFLAGKKPQFLLKIKVEKDAKKCAIAM
jgi:hypothetical protein